MRIKYIRQALSATVPSTDTSFRFPEKRLPACQDSINVDNPTAFRLCVETMFEAEVIGFDVETVGCDPKSESPVGRARVISLQLSDGNISFFIPNWGPWSGLIQEFREVLSSPVAKTAHNAKYDMHSLANHGITVRGPIYDTLVMDWLVYNGELSHDLKGRVNKLWGLDLPDFEESFSEPILKKNGEPSKRSRLIPLDEAVSRGDGWIARLIEYAVKDPLYGAKLFFHLKEKMHEIEWVPGKDYFEYFKTFDMPYTEVLFSMEREGAAVNVDTLNKTGDDFREQAQTLENEILNMLSDLGFADSFLANLNLNAPQQIGEVLSQIGVTTGKMTPKGKPSYGKDALHEITDPVAKPIIDKILELKGLKKLIADYCEGLRDEAIFHGGKIHTVFNHAGTATMRLSSKNPNLQNVPVRSDNGKLIRKAFEAPIGYVLGVIDMSQIQLRLLAHFSGDPVMVKAYREGWDLHALTAVKAFSKVTAFVGSRELTLAVLEEVKEAFKKDRRDAKDINFGVIFGMGPVKYAQKTGRSEDEGRKAISGFFDTYPNVRPTIKAVHKSVKERGYLRTLLRRYVYIPNINSPIPAFRAEAERQAFNYLIQGSEADLMKMAMLLIHRDPDLRRMGVKLMLQVHDELVLLIPRDYVEEATPLIEEYVSHPYRHFGFRDLKVDTPAELGVAENWAEAK